MAVVEQDPSSPGEQTFLQRGVASTKVEGASRAAKIGWVGQPRCPGMALAVHLEPDRWVACRKLAAVAPVAQGQRARVDGQCVPFATGDKGWHRSVASGKGIGAPVLELARLRPLEAQQSWREHGEAGAIAHHHAVWMGERLAPETDALEEIGRNTRGH